LIPRQRTVAAAKLRVSSVEQRPLKTNAHAIVDNFIRPFPFFSLPLHFDILSRASHSGRRAFYLTSFRRTLPFL